MWAFDLLTGYVHDLDLAGKKKDLQIFLAI